MTTCPCWVPREGVLNSCESNLCLREDTTDHESTEQQCSNKTVSKIDPQFYLFIYLLGGGGGGVFFQLELPSVILILSQSCSHSWLVIHTSTSRYCTNIPVLLYINLPNKHSHPSAHFLSLLKFNP